MSERRTGEAGPARKGARRERGFSMLQLLIVMAVIAIITVMALIGTSTAKNSLTLTNATRELASYLERARIDAITRHASNSLTINSATSYSIDIDVDGSGTAETRTVTLPTGVTISVTNPSTGTTVTLPTTITFDKRGRSSSQSKVVLSMSGSSDTGVMMTGSGDITVNSNVIGPATTTSITPITSVSNTAYTRDIATH